MTGNVKEYLTIGQRQTICLRLSSQHEVRTKIKEAWSYKHLQYIHSVIRLLLKNNDLGHLRGILENLQQDMDLTYCPTFMSNIIDSLMFKTI